MPQVTVIPANIVFTCDPGEPIMEAAIRHGYRWPTVCHGQAECGACIAEIVEGADTLTSIASKEAERLEAQPRLGAFRLACCASPTGDGDIVVLKRGVRAMSSNRIL